MGVARYSKFTTVSGDTGVARQNPLPLCCQQRCEEKGIETAVTAALHDFIGFEPKIEFEKEKIIERDANGKFYESICSV